MNIREEFQTIESTRRESINTLKEKIINNLKLLLELKGEVKSNHFFIKTPPSFDVPVNKSGSVRYAGILLAKESEDLHLKDTKGTLHTLRYALKITELIELWEALSRR